MPDLNKHPKVSVLMITYNHEKFIEQAVRSVMMQETDFDYELVIGEDCSTDNTREIVLKLKVEFPDKIRLLLHEQNIGMIPNMVATYNACTGEYIALCEGDDYWTDPKKLQIQVDYMDAHPECRICFHAATAVDEKAVTFTIAPPSKGKVNFKRWLRHRSTYNTYIATATILFRPPFNKLPEWYLKLSFAGDWPLIVWLMLNGGSLSYISNDPMTVYRKHSGGATKRETDPYISIVKLMRDLNDHFVMFDVLDPKFHKLIYPRLYVIYKGLSYNYLQLNDLISARKYTKLAFRYVLTTRKIRIKSLFLLFLRSYVPHVYNVLLALKYRNA